MELVLPMYNVHLYFSLTNLGKNVCIIHSKIWVHMAHTVIYFVIGTETLPIQSPY